MYDSEIEINEVNNSSLPFNTPTVRLSVVPSNKNIKDIVNNDVILYFWNDMGGSFMGCVSGASPPMLQADASKSAKFCIVWVDAHASKVAIKSVKSEGYERYLSCGTKNPMTNSALGSFSSIIGHKETFTVWRVNNSFLFQSHNDLFLHYNETFHSVAFKTCSERDENDIPKKGRWSLLLENETNRVGTKNGLTHICYQISVGVVEVAFRAADSILNSD